MKRGLKAGKKHSGGFGLNVFSDCEIIMEAALNGLGLNVVGKNALYPGNI